VNQNKWMDVEWMGLESDGTVGITNDRIGPDGPSGTASRRQEATSEVHFLVRDGPLRSSLLQSTNGSVATISQAVGVTTSWIGA